MLAEKLQDYLIILASSSPRRQQFLTEMEIPYRIQKMPVAEVYPESLKGAAISDYLAVLKAKPYWGTLRENEILITSDTVVWHNGRSLAKPQDDAEAIAMLQTLSDSWHEVITSVCFTTPHLQKTVTETTRVKFRALQEAEIHHYVRQYRPFDKAGGYGIQEWIGLVGIEEIQGSYPNVVGLPTQLVYKTLMALIA